MLKKISVDQVRLGMHLHALEGAWIDHPFWKTRFVLSDAADLRKLRASNVREVWIDPAKGLDVAAADDRPGLPPVAAPSPPRAHAAAGLTPAGTAPARAPAPPPPSHSMADELNEAAAICKRGRQAVMADLLTLCSRMTNRRSMLSSDETIRAQKEACLLPKPKRDCVIVFVSSGYRTCQQKNKIQ